MIEAIDAPPIDNMGIVVIVPEGFGGASAILTLTCSMENPMTAIIGGNGCTPMKATFTYTLSEPSTLLIVDADIPRPCHLQIDILATKGSITGGTSGPPARHAPWQALSWTQRSEGAQQLSLQSATSDPLSWTQSATKMGNTTVGVSDSNPIVIGLPYSIYEPITLT